MVLNRKRLSAPGVSAVARAEARDATLTNVTRPFPPPPGVPIGRSFPGLNLRTYVRHDGDPGVYFFRLDADDRLGSVIARLIFGLPYYAAETTVRRRGEEIRFRSRRRGEPPLQFDAAYAPDGPAFPADERPLARFLVERYRFFARARGRLVAGPIRHDPWTLAGPPHRPDERLLPGQRVPDAR